MEDATGSDGVVSRVIRDTVLSYIIAAVLIAGAGLYLADDPLQVITDWLKWVIIAGVGCLGMMRLVYLVRASFTGWGAVAPATGTTAPSLAAEPDTLAAMRPEDVFGLWANASLVTDPAGVVIANEAYRSYEQACSINGVQAVTSNRFGVMLTRRAETSGGTIIKTKSNGRMAYRGWSLADSGGPTQDAVAP